MRQTFEQMLISMGRGILERLGNPEIKDVEDLKKWIAGDTMFKQVIEGMSYPGEAASNYLSLANWVSSGSNTLRLSEGLVCSLILTEYPGSVIIRLPHKSVLLSIPSGILFLARVDGIPVPITRLLLSEVPFEGGNIQIVFYRHTGGENLADRLTPIAIAKYNQQNREERGRDPRVAMTLRLISNLMLWLDAAGKNDKKKIKITKKQRKRADKREWPKVWILGTKVKVTQEITDAAKALVSGEPTSIEDRRSWKLRMQHVVRGHWKMQRCGTKRLEKKRIWVEPYMRGPEGKVAWSHIYEA